MTDPEERSTTYRYDRFGNLTAAIDALGFKTTFQYNRLGQKLLETRPVDTGKSSTTRYYYDKAGNFNKIVDPEGYVTNRYYTDRNLLEAVELVLGNNKANITKMEYDNEGNLKKLIQGLNSWTDPVFAVPRYEYDALNRLTSEFDPAGRRTKYDYDGNGNLVTTTDRNGVITQFEYDGLNRIETKKNSQDGSSNVIEYAYDLLGNTRKATNAAGATVFDYDQPGRLLTADYGNGIKKSYDYDQADRITGLQVKQGSVTELNIDYEYDKTGRLTLLKENGKQYSYKYDDLGKLDTELNGVTGTKTEYQYYPSGQVKTLRHFNGDELLASYQYKYDLRGNQTEKEEAGKLTKYYYDPLSRLKTVIQPNDDLITYQYDDLGNIKEMAEVNGSMIFESSYYYDNSSRLQLKETVRGNDKVQTRFSYNLTGNQLSKEEVITSNGNMIASKTFSFGYNGFGQLASVIDPNGSMIEYTYGADGLRSRKQIDDNVTNYYYQNGSIVLETDADNRITAKNIFGNRLISREADSSTLYYLHNAHGDVTKVVDTQGKQLKDYTYDPFGQEKKALAFDQEQWSREIDNPFRYSGEYLDAETGNYYLRARYYDPAMQRFISEDSYKGNVDSPLSLNVYSYAHNNPIFYIDPTGHYLESALDVAFVTKDIKDVVEDPTNLENYVVLIGDAFFLFVPGFAGGGQVIKYSDDVFMAVNTILEKVLSGPKIRLVLCGIVLKQSFLVRGREKLVSGLMKLVTLNGQQMMDLQGHQKLPHFNKEHELIGTD